MAQIRVKNGPQKGKCFPITGNKPIVIGREPTCQLQVIDKGVSREHAQIFRMGEMVFLRDMDSRNGTFVNEERVTEELLREGDVIRVGVTQLIFESKINDEARDVQYDEDAPFRASLELKVEDLYVLESEHTGRDKDLFKAICLATQIVQQERDEKIIFERLLTLVKEYIPADVIYVFLRDGNTGAVTPRCVVPKGQHSDVLISRSILKHVLNEALAVMTADAMKDERFNTGDSIVMNKIRSVLCVPIQSNSAKQGSGEKAIGAIYAVNSGMAETFEQVDLQLLTAVGNQLALSLENLYGTRKRRQSLLQIIGRLTSLLEGVPPRQRGHAERVAVFAGAIAMELGLPEPQILLISMAGLLHDIGKFPAVSPLALNLNDRTASVAPVMAALEFFKDIPNLTEVMSGIQSHHERYDGTGVPLGLIGEQIPLPGRILGVANIFDKLVFPTGNLAPDVDPDPVLVRKAFSDMDAQKGKLFDPEVIRALMVAFRHGLLRSVTGAVSSQMDVVTTDKSDVSSKVFGSGVLTPLPKGAAIVDANLPEGQTGMTESLPDLPVPTGETIRTTSGPNITPHSKETKKK